MSYEIYKERMLAYYPQIIQAIRDFQALNEAEYPEFGELDSSNQTVLNNAYIKTMDESRIVQWEKILGITPVAGSTFSDRRDTILARIRSTGKLNTSLINTIVNTFTGGTAESWVENSVLHVVITPPPESREYIFSNVVQELSKKVPAHLGLEVSRNYFTWGDINDEYDDWDEMMDDLPTWEDVLLFIPFEE